MTQTAPRTLRIGELAELTGTTPRTIRFYEEIGVLPAAEDREPGKRRLYSEADVERLREVVRLRDLLGLSLEEVRELAEAESARAHIRREFQETDDPEERHRLLEAALPYIERQLELVRGRIGELQKLEEELVARRKRVRTRLREQ
ncbi:MAG TPA: MerR family transcriptional regulator [Thermoleophilaceae bacterium]